jgi:hypothetical protein
VLACPRHPFRQMASETIKSRVFLEEFDPFRHFYWRAEGGWRSGNTLDVRVLLALRQLPRLAEECRVCVCVEVQCNPF